MVIIFVDVCSNYVRSANKLIIIIVRGIIGVASHVKHTRATKHAINWGIK